MSSATSSANVNSSSNSANLLRSSSLRRLKLDREHIPVHYGILDLPAMTWRDRGEVEANPNTDHRIAGFVTEDVAVVSSIHGGFLDPLLMLDEDDELLGIAYDRITAYLIPVIRDIHERVAALETARIGT